MSTSPSTLRPTALLGALLSLLLAVACDDGTTEVQEDPVPASIAAVAGDGQTGVVGERLASPLAVEVRDQEGAPIDGVSVAWNVTAGGGSVSAASSTTDGSGRASTTWTLGTAASATQTARARVSGAGDVVFTATAEAGAAVMIIVTPDSVQLEALGATAQLTATSADRYGNPVADVEATWGVVNDVVVAVDATGLVEARANGRGVVFASAEAGSDTAVVRVRQVAASVAVAAPADSVAVGGTLALVGTATDANGFAIPDATFAWGSSLDAVALVDGDGVVTGVAPGPVEITAAVDGESASASLTVRATTAPVLSAIEPARLTPGATATITGDGFSPVPAANTVTIDGVPAEVTTATGTAVTVTLAGGAAFDCGLTHAATVSLTVPGATGTAEHELAVARQVDLGVGEVVRLLDPVDAACSELVAPAQAATGGGGADESFLISVFNTGTSYQDVAAFRLLGETVAGENGAPVPAGLRTPPARRLAGSTGSAGSTPGHRVAADVSGPGRHVQDRVLAANRRFFETHRPTPPAPGGAPASPLADAPPEVGEVRTFRVPRIDAEDPCQAFTTVDARAVHVGARAVVFEDVAAPLAGTMDDYFARLADEFDDIVYAILVEYFGDPLALDAVLDDNGRVFLLFTTAVNDIGGIDTMVFSGDLVDAGQCAQSNAAEMIYGVLPTEPGTGIETFTKDRWLWLIRGSVVNGSKHLADFASRLTAGVDHLDAFWLLNATARMAEELWARQVYGHTRYGNTDYASSIYCELRPEAAECSDAPVAMFRHFLGVYDYLAEVDARTPLGPYAAGDRSYYDSGWLLLRWAADHFAASEADFLQALVHEPELTGVANLEARTGRSFAEMLADFTLTFWLDEQNVVTDPTIDFPGWDTYDIFAGLNADGPDTFPWAHPLFAWAPVFGDWFVDTSVRAGSTTFVLLSGDRTGTQLLRLVGPDGGPPPGDLRLAIIRME